MNLWLALRLTVSSLFFVAKLLYNYLDQINKGARI
jgi:hypothetical protein